LIEDIVNIVQLIRNWLKQYGAPMRVLALC